MQISSPLLLGPILFGIIFGFTGALTNLPVYLVSFMSMFIFAGASQFLILLLLQNDLLLVGIVLTAILVNLRHILYSVVLQRIFTLNGWSKALYAHFLIDETFLVATIVQKEFQQISSNSQEPSWRPEFVFLYTGFAFWILWNLSTIFGYFLYSFVGELINFPGNFVIAASFVGYLADHFRKYSEDRAFIFVLAILSLIFGIFFDNSLVLVFVIGCGSLLSIGKTFFLKEAKL